MDGTRERPWLVLSLLFTINTLNFFDRQILSAVAEAIRIEWHLTDAQLGWLATSFTFLYAAAGLPLGRLADTWKRKWLLAAGLAVWSGMTCLSGWSTGFRSLLLTRLGVGIGEATCAPAATSLIGDLFPAARRARALSLFMLGLPLGLALSYAISGAVAQNHGWRAAFFIAAAPGFILALAILYIADPLRGAKENGSIGSATREGAPLFIVLRIPTMWFIILSGALHNFNLYALGTFLPAFLMRHHNISVQAAGFLSAVVIGGMGALGMLAAGWFGDLVTRRNGRGRMILATTSLGLSLPFCVLAISLPPGNTLLFVVFLGISYAFMYTYYPLSYSTIQDIVEPALRGTAMAVYFCAMYFLGASAGPIITGWLSDQLALAAANSSHAPAGMMQIIPETFKAAGLQQAMYVVPALGILLLAALIAGTCTVERDRNKLRAWMGRFKDRDIA